MGTPGIVGTVANAVVENGSWKLLQFNFRGLHDAQNNHDTEF